MKRFSLAIAIASGLCMHSAAESRVIDYPFISYSNTNYLPYAIFSVVPGETVDCDGNAKGRPDLRDHTKYIKEIKALL